MEELLAAGVHFGHQSSRWHPKMKPFIYGVRGGVHITNLDETVRLLPQALDFLSGIAARGGSVLFVGTKPQARELVKAAAESCGQPYVHNRWLGGTMTNFAEIKRLIKKFVDLKDKQAKGELAKYTKQEQVWFARDIEDMDRKVGGIQTMMTTPDAIVIIDIKAEKTALMEAKQKNVPVVAIVDTNVNPDQVDYPIPGNDDGIKSIGLMLTLMAEAINEGKANAVKIAAAAKAAKDEEADTKVKAEAVAAVEELDEKIAEELATKKMEEKVSA
jgi:small subunit ribosomal protein S2